MDKDFILNKWIPALRSGNYRQGKGALCNDNNEYCCLGVACDLIDPNGWNELYDGDDNPYYGWKDAESYLPEMLGCQIFGDVPRPFNPDLEVNGRIASLAMHNDVWDATFEQIADGLEAWVHAQEAA